MREMNQLVNTEDSAWPIIQNWLKDATNHTELLPVNKDLAETALYQLQVTTKSPMGALVYGSGGLLIDNGWLRIAGSGHPRLPRDPEVGHNALNSQACGLYPSLTMSQGEFLLLMVAILGKILAAFIILRQIR